MHTEGAHPLHVIITVRFRY